MEKRYKLPLTRNQTIEIKQNFPSEYENWEKLVKELSFLEKCTNTDEFFDQIRILRSKVTLLEVVFISKFPNLINEHTKPICKLFENK